MINVNPESPPHDLAEQTSAETLITDQPPDEIVEGNTPGPPDPNDVTAMAVETDGSQTDGNANGTGVPTDEGAANDGSCFVVHATFYQWFVPRNQQLGSGAFAVVKEATSQSGLKAVVKICDISPSTEKRSLYAWRELACLAYLTGGQAHPNLVRFHDVALVGNSVYIFMERVEGIELFEFLRTFDQGLPTDHARTITAQLLSALRFLHRHNILHRDIKLDNIIVNPQTLRVKLIDFNLSCIYREGVALAEPVGCINYSSLQILEAAMGKPYFPEKGWSDLWALGVTVFGMLCGYFPFRNEKPKKLAKEHLALHTNPLNWHSSSVDPIAQSFVETILTPKSLGIISAESLMEHPFVAGHEDLTADSHIIHIAHPFEDLLVGNDALVSTDLDLQEEAVTQLIQEIIQSTRFAVDAEDATESVQSVPIDRATSDSTVGGENNRRDSNPISMEQDLSDPGNGLEKCPIVEPIGEGMPVAASE
ncbi:kinase-like protein [Gonapodya prolifera JEL478]|uniref:Kinase-like protein n=1 Tax=Gonapodya prolifera (strain JEL478) TaxID=1344416 RepID=A0A139AS81_GONPJ|nr:kinase-like protein [Gonapodya prolifera JEL478]|eukprot:KXS19616.1 kinase-like protein [Gonapodya prolifera JEL478]